MKNFTTQATRSAGFLMLLTLILYTVVVAAPPSSTARVVEGATVLVTNNSSRAIRYLYFSPTDSESWSENQLTDASLAPGQAVSITSDSCPGAEIKVIGEDMDGCFVSVVVSCSGNASWTITNEAVPNCGY